GGRAAPALDHSGGRLGERLRAGQGVEQAARLEEGFGHARQGAVDQPPVDAEPGPHAGGEVLILQTGVAVVDDQLRPQGGDGLGGGGPAAAAGEGAGLGQAGGEAGQGGEGVGGGPAGPGGEPLTGDGPDQQGGGLAGRDDVAGAGFRSGGAGLCAES